MVEITAIHMVGGEGHDHIAELKWRDPADGMTGRISRAGMVKFIRDDKARAYVQDRAHKNRVGCVNADPPYVRTYADGIWNNNLLALPKY